MHKSKNNVGVLYLLVYLEIDATVLATTFLNLLYCYFTVLTAVLRDLLRGLLLH